MMELRKSLTLLTLSLLPLVISGCSTFGFGAKPEKEIVVETKVIERNIPIQAWPRPITMNDVTWYVVTEENYQEFLDKYKKENGEPWVFYVISVRGYEALSLNMAEIRRYVEQQQKIIIYYENAVKPINQQDSAGGEKSGEKTSANAKDN